MGEFLIEVIFEGIIQSLSYIGASVKWVFLRNKFSYKEILKHNWNYRIGILVMILVFFLIFQLT